MKELESFARVGVMPHRSYYIPFADGDKVETRHGIVDRRSSSRFLSLDGIWQISSHYGCRYLEVKDGFGVTAEKPFSCSVNPYTTRQLRDTRHDFELTENDFVNVCLDVAMRGVGSHSCGPALEQKYEIPRAGENTFTLVF